ncbi:CMRF35-like molecule 5 isoform X4 [Chelmon rostratus]|uniref:CMRF35-like molecule 5 isoform X4 n=1 Tax=Chelmon rostratus TaxID=109905 RepID=UPI001BECD4B1|nr:CMRF35-like molecule 5 isoform X4 [Chelmon rostratus]
MLDQCTNPGGTIQNKNQRTGNLSVRMKSISVFFCLLYAMWTEGTSINVMGFERGKVSFQCSHRLAWRNFKYLCKDPCKQDTDMLATVKSGRRVESGRITLVDLGNGVFTVTFSQLQLSDSGKYWCAVDRPGFDTFTAVYLTVKTAVAQETTTATPELSVSTSAQLTSATNLSTVEENRTSAQARCCTPLSGVLPHLLSWRSQHASGNAKKTQNLDHKFAPTAQAAPVHMLTMNMSSSRKCGLYKNYLVLCT